MKYRTILCLLSLVATPNVYGMEAEAAPLAGDAATPSTGHVKERSVSSPGDASAASDSTLTALTKGPRIFAQARTAVPSLEAACAATTESAFVVALSFIQDDLTSYAETLASDDDRAALFLTLDQALALPIMSFQIAPGKGSLTADLRLPSQSTEVAVALLIEEVIKLSPAFATALETDDVAAYKKALKVVHARSSSLLDAIDKLCGRQTAICFDDIVGGKLTVQETKLGIAQ